MSCECEKIRDLYDRLNVQHLDALTEARGHMYSSATGNGRSDVSASQMPAKPRYDGSPSMGQRMGYGSSSPRQGGTRVVTKSYDIAPAKMPAFVNDYAQKLREMDSYQGVHNEASELEVQADRLAEMITQARGEEEQRWMSTMQ